MSSRLLRLHLPHPSTSHGQQQTVERQKSSTLWVVVCSAGTTLTGASRTRCRARRANKRLTGLRPVSVGDCARRLCTSASFTDSARLRRLRRPATYTRSRPHFWFHLLAVTHARCIRHSSASYERLCPCTAPLERSRKIHQQRVVLGIVTASFVSFLCPPRISRRDHHRSQLRPPQDTSVPIFHGATSRCNWSFLIACPILRSFWFLTEPVIHIVSRPPAQCNLAVSSKFLRHCTASSCPLAHVDHATCLISTLIKNFRSVSDLSCCFELVLESVSLISGLSFTDICT